MKKDYCKISIRPVSFLDCFFSRGEIVRIRGRDYILKEEGELEGSREIKEKFLESFREVCKRSGGDNLSSYAKFW